jgi:acetyltransferase
MTPDLAVICTPPDSVPGIIAELAERGTKGAVIITAGFGEGGGEHGHELRRQVLETARPHLLRIIGPNCLGILVPGSGVNASFCHVTPKKGRLAFVTQSGAIVTSVVDWAEARGIGFSHLISLGDMIDVDFGDLLDYLANDPEVKAILLYIEAVTDARKFMSAARAAARMKPVIVVKSGRHAEGAKAAASHTGALAGADNVYDTIFSRAGMLRVLTLDELFDAVEILDIADAPKGDRLAILTNGGGIGVLATDALIDEGGRLAEISPDTIEKLNKVLPVTWSHGNPIDIIGDATGKRYADALSATLEDKNVDAVLVLNCPTAVASNMECAKAVVEAVKKHKGANVLTSWVGDATALAARDVFQANRIPSYASPEHAVRAFMYMVRYRQSQEILMETPPSVPEEFTPDTAKVKERGANG